eukprot:CAMPEP_0114133508 /NCGR_PEP_ID=MMETSP0043_2-20121206/13666_1 /TAXON_ID=464988 /ORGANISM="Hemiselmis andersenii, Strain CCMP644" /LENGTH=63 /DNA_ID=CAMNT_0001227095 /DNA_START=428 /DNA_END=615 /DNA_ORIENTATION=+
MRPMPTFFSDVWFSITVLLGVTLCFPDLFCWASRLSWRVPEGEQQAVRPDRKLLIPTASLTTP